MQNETKGVVTISVIGLLLLAVVGGGLMFGLPVYSVWKQGMVGKAALRRAEQEKQIMIETAKAELESAKIRSMAIAEVGRAAQQYPEYRHQEFIAAFGEAIQSGTIDQIIYVPTEANIPIVEAGRIGVAPRE